MNRADHRAAHVAAWDEASPSEDEWPSVVMLSDHPAAAPGWTAFAAVGGRGVTVLPTLLPDAPPSVQQRYFSRALGTLAGKCPACGAVAGLSGNPERPAAWATLPLTVSLPHTEACPAVFRDADQKYFDSRAIGRSHGPDDAA